MFAVCSWSGDLTSQNLFWETTFKNMCCNWNLQIQTDEIQHLKVYSGSFLYIKQTKKLYERPKYQNRLKKKFFPAVPGLHYNINWLNFVLSFLKYRWLWCRPDVHNLWPLKEPEVPWARWRHIHTHGFLLSVELI